MVFVTTTSVSGVRLTTVGRLPRHRRRETTVTYAHLDDGALRDATATVKIGVLFLTLRSFDLLHSSRVNAVLHMRTTSWSSNQPTWDIWLATLPASFVYTITARLR